MSKRFLPDNRLRRGYMLPLFHPEAVTPGETVSVFSGLTGYGARLTGYGAGSTGYGEGRA